jgi:hypothetical protein
VRLSPSAGPPHLLHTQPTDLARLAVAQLQPQLFNNSETS